MFWRWRHLQTVIIHRIGIQFFHLLCHSHVWRCCSWIFGHGHVFRSFDQSCPCPRSYSTALFLLPMQNAHGGLLLRNNEAIIGARTASRERELSARQFPRFSTFVKFAHFSDFQMSIFSKITDLQICKCAYHAAIYDLLLTSESESFVPN